MMAPATRGRTSTRPTASSRPENSVQTGGVALLDHGDRNRYPAGGAAAPADAGAT